jgi:hypothetical protein
MIQSIVYFLLIRTQIHPNKKMQNKVPAYIHNPNQYARYLLDIHNNNFCIVYKYSIQSAGNKQQVKR